VQENAPLAGLKVIEFAHMVMGPTVGLVLADLGADVIKVEPIGGDKTRRLKGSGAGYFTMYNRNKRSICLDLKSNDGKAIALKMISTADIFVENFRLGALDKLGFGYDDLSALNERLIYCSEKGFLSGPYENRTALDEVAQMMGGLAYMTGPPGRPLRAGASVIDVAGGMFGAIAVLAALRERDTTGRGQHVQASLYETTAFLVGQHMAQFGVTGQAAAPMPARISAWAVYDVFDAKDGEKVFVGVVSDGQWVKFCEAFGLDDWAGDESLADNNARVERRETIIPHLRELFQGYDLESLMAKLETIGLPYAPIARPEDLFEDPHLNAAGGLLEMELPDGDGAPIKLPALPVKMGDARPGLRRNPPKAGQHTREILESLGLSDTEVSNAIGSAIAGESKSILHSGVQGE